MAYELLLFNYYYYYYYYSTCFASAKCIWKLLKHEMLIWEKNAFAQPIASGFVQWNWSTMHGFTKQGIAHCNVTFGVRRLKWTNQWNRRRVTRGETERGVERERETQLYRLAHMYLSSSQSDMWFDLACARWALPLTAGSRLINSPGSTCQSAFPNAV